MPHPTPLGYPPREFSRKFSAREIKVFYSNSSQMSDFRTSILLKMSIWSYTDYFGSMVDIFIAYGILRIECYIVQFLYSSANRENSLDTNGKPALI